MGDISELSLLNLTTPVPTCPTAAKRLHITIPSVANQTFGMPIMKSVSTPPIGAVVLKEGNALTLGLRMLRILYAYAARSNSRKLGNTWHDDGDMGHGALGVGRRVL